MRHRVYTYVYTVQSTTVLCRIRAGTSPVYVCAGVRGFPRIWLRINQG